MDRQPLLSVITPSFNHAPYIRQTIESVLHQEYGLVEHIVVDGGSTDGTLEILREYEVRFPGRFRWISEPDDGQSDAFNKGLAMARGEFVGWQNSDDYYLPRAFAEPVHFLQAHTDVAVVYGQCLLVDEAGRQVGKLPVGQFDFARLLFFNYIPNQAAFIRRDAFVACGGMATNLHYLMDQDLWLRLALSHRLVFLAGERGALRLLATAKTNVGQVKSRLEAIQIVEQLLAAPRCPPGIRETGRVALARHCMDALLAALALDEGTTARALLRKALASDPPLAEWDYFRKRLLMRRAITETWFGHLDAETVQSVPARTLALLREADLAGTPHARQLIAFVSLFHALLLRGHRGEHGSGSYLLQALRADRSWLRFPASSIVMLRLLCGDAAVDRLHPLMRSLRRLSDWRNSRRSPVAT